MQSTSIKIEPYLAEYIKGKYGECIDEPIKIPDNTDLYHTVWSLMTLRKGNQDPDDANLTIFLPFRKVGKDPRYHNYLSNRSAKIIENTIKKMFDRDLHIAMEENDQKGRPLNNIDVAYGFLQDYAIESITDGALLKNFYRYRENIRRKQCRRKYDKRC